MDTVARFAAVAWTTQLAFGCYVGLDPASADDENTGSETSGPSGGTEDGEDGGESETDGRGTAVDFGPLWMSRLTRAEYGACVHDVLGVTIPVEDLGSLPDAEPSPFDNAAESQTPSATLVNGYERLARQVADAVVSAPAMTESLAPCSQGESTSTCLERAIETLGRRLLRRPMSAAETEALIDLGTRSEDYEGAVRVVLMALLQDPEFLYRVEIGEAVDSDDTLRRLSDFEVASRLSFLLWGVGPDDALLDKAAAGEVHTPGQVRAEAERMLDSPKARQRVQRFFSLWLGYEVLPHDPELAAAMKLESDSLVGRVFEDQLPWHAVLTSEETFLTPALAEHYGFEAGASGDGAWVPYGDAARGGLLSHGSFLALGSKFGDTSPVVRGLEVRERLLCLEMAPPPPDLEVDIDSPPPGGAECKADLYRPLVEDSQCAGCHLQLNPVGFGLENFDALGRYRETEPGKPQCPIDGVGELPTIGEFSGPGELGALLATSERAQLCASTQMLRYWLGRPELEPDAPLVEDFARSAEEADGDLRTLLLDFVGRESFGYRQLPGGTGE